MTDSRVAEALRDIESAKLAYSEEVYVRGKTQDQFERLLDRAIAAYGEACREGGVYEGMDPALHYHDRCHDARLEAEAAARLAGIEEGFRQGATINPTAITLAKLEQAERAATILEQLPGGTTLLQYGDWITNEVLRLRREAKGDA